MKRKLIIAAVCFLSLALLCGGALAHSGDTDEKGGHTELWLTRSGGCILASSGSRIPDAELNELMEFISAQFFLICREWKKFFLVDEIKFYC